MRLIDADALMKVFANLIPWCIDTPEEVAFTNGLSSAYEATKNAPAIDAVPVVRCKDCRYYQDNNGGYPNADCKWCKDETPDADDYCSCGERKDDDKSCDTCKHYDKGWDDAICDGCTKAHSNWERRNDE